MSQLKLGQLKEHEFPKVTVKSTRFKGLSYAYFGPSHWQLIDTSDMRHNAWNTIGWVYPLQSELLADVERFAKERGYI